MEEVGDVAGRHRIVFDDKECDGSTHYDTPLKSFQSYWLRNRWFILDFIEIKLKFQKAFHRWHSLLFALTVVVEHLTSI